MISCSVANTGYADFAFTRMPAIAINNEHQFSSSLTWTRGSHIVKFWGQHIRNYKDEVDSITDGGDRGTYDFGVSASTFDTNYGPSNVLTGALARFQQVQNIKKKNAIYTDVHVFVQDTWKVRSNLTFDFGIRFYHVPTQHELRPAETLDAVFPAQQMGPGQGAAILYLRPHESFGCDRSGESQRPVHRSGGNHFAMDHRAWVRRSAQRRVCSGRSRRGEHRRAESQVAAICAARRICLVSGRECQNRDSRRLRLGIQPHQHFAGDQ
jgi:hypothetical protein